jgi:hypothetical protein
MKVLDFILDVAASDLRQIALRDVGTNSANDTSDQKVNMTTVLSFVNQGLVSLYTKFPIKVDIYEADVELYDTTTAGINELGTIRLPDNALSMIGITTDDYIDVPVDDKNIEYQYRQGAYNKLFIRTVAYNTFVVGGKNEDNTKSLYISYTCAPPTVKLSDVLPLSTNFMEALRMYVAYRGYSTIRSVTQLGDEGVNYLKKYESVCKELEGTIDTMYDYITFDENRLYKKGFV